jgi:hypothetical protein
MFAKKHVPFMLFILATSVVSGQPLHEMGIMQQFKKLEQKYSPQLFIAALLLLLNIPLCIGQVHTGMALDAFKQHGKKTLRVYTDVQIPQDSVLIPNKLVLTYVVWKHKGKTHVTEKTFDIKSDKVINTNETIFGKDNNIISVDDRGDDGGSTVESYQYNSKGLLAEHITTTCYSLLDCETERICYSYDAQNRTEKSTTLNGKDTVEVTTHYYDSLTGLLQLSRTINFIKPKPVDPSIGIGFNSSFPFLVSYHYENQLLKTYEVNYSDSSSYVEVNMYDASGRLTAKSETYYFRKKFAEFTRNSTYNTTGKIVREELVRPYTGILLEEMLFFYDRKGLLIRNERHFFNPDKVTTTTYIYE